MLLVNVSLYRPEFHGRQAGNTVDWPPSPRRLLGALLSGAFVLEDENVQEQALAALRAISSSPPPIIDAPQYVDLNMPQTFTQRTWLPNSKTQAELGKVLDTTLLGIDTKSRDLKPLGKVALAGCDISYLIDVDLDEGQIEALQQASREVA